MDARTLMEMLQAQVPSAIGIDAGTTAYAWLIVHAADRSEDGLVGVPPMLLALPLVERSEMPLGRVAFIGGAGESLTSIELTQLAEREQGS